MSRRKTTFVGVVEQAVCFNLQAIYKRGLRVDLRHAQANGRLAYRFGDNSWTLGFMLKGDTEGRPSHIVFSHPVRSGFAQYDVQLTPTRTSIGQRPRWWLVCPACFRRCARLYLSQDGERFVCRICAKLTFASCRSTKHDGLIRQAEKIEGRLDAGGTRPHGMRLTTYMRLRTRAAAYRKRASDILLASCVRGM